MELVTLLCIIGVICGFVVLGFLLRFIWEVPTQLALIASILKEIKDKINT